MSLTTSSTAAGLAVKTILGCYPEVSASDKQIFVAGLMEMLMRMPPEVVKLAANPAQGIPAKLKFLNLAEIRALLDDWSAEYHDRQRRIAGRRAPVVRRIEIERMKPRPGDLANVFVPEGHYRYPALCSLAKTLDPAKFEFGWSSDGRRGIWISWDNWDGGEAARSIGHGLDTLIAGAA